MAVWHASYIWTFTLLQVVSGSVVWSYQSGSSAEDFCNAVAVDPNTRDVVVAGATAGDFHGNSRVGFRDWVAVKLDQDGVLQWTYHAGEAWSSSEIHGVAIDASSNVVLVGTHQGNLFGTGIGFGDIAVAMLNSAGVLQWSTQQGTLSIDVATCVAIDSSGNVVVGGYYVDVFGDDDPVLLKLNGAGALQWLLRTELATSGNDYIYGLTTDDSDHIFVTGEVGASFDSNTYYGNHDAVIFKTDGTGTVQWSYQIGSTLDDTGTGIAISNGDVYGAGHTLGSLPGHTNVGTQSDGFIVKLNAAGVQQWLRQITPATDSKEVVNGLMLHPFLDRVAIYGSRDDNFWAYELDGSGTFQWAYSTGLPGEEVFNGGAYDVNGDLILAGRANGEAYGNAHSGNFDFVAVKLNPASSTTTSQGATSTGSTTATFSTTGASSTTGTSSITMSSTTMSSSATSSSQSYTMTSSSTTSSTFTVSSTTAASNPSLQASAAPGTTAGTTTGTTTGTTAGTTSATTAGTAPQPATTTVPVAEATPETTQGPSAPAEDEGPTTEGDPTTTETTTAAPVLRLTRSEIATLEAQRQAEAAATVARLQAAEDSALAQLANGSQETTVPTALGALKVAPLAAAMVVEGFNASISAGTLEEIVVAMGVDREEPGLLFSVLAMNETSNLETDGVVGTASSLVSATLSLNFWRNDGSRIEVKDLVNPIEFTLEVTDADAKCAFWNEDTGKWSTDGVTTLASSNGSIECSTSHLTIFAGIKEVFLANVALAFKCSTISSLLSGPAFANLRHTAWLSSTPSILNLVFHSLGAVCILLAWRYDRKQEKTIPWGERELFLMQVKDDEVEEEEDADAPPPSRWTRCTRCCQHTMEYASHVSGGDATVEALKEMVGNADTAAVNRAISTIQSHKARVARAQIAIFNKLQLKEGVEEAPRATRRLSRRSSISTASEVVVAETLEKTADLGQSAAQTFLQRGWLCRVATLWPASHPCLKAMHFSMLAPVRASVALLVLKITSAGALGAVFFSSSSPTPDSDPDCFPRKGAVEQVIQSLTVGFVTALLSDVIVSILFAMQLKKVVFSRTEWTERKKRRQRLRWRIRTLTFWLILLLYGTFCELYICLFLANVTERNRREWLQSLGVTLLNDLLLKSFLTAFILATIASLVLCCRPHVTEKIHAKWIKGRDEVKEAEAVDCRVNIQEGELSNGSDILYVANLDTAVGFEKSFSEDIVTSCDPFEDASV